MMNELWARRLLVSIAADLEPYGLREWWGLITMEERDKLMRCFPAIRPKWWLYQQACRCTTK
jgi:hypothetical protein